MDAKLNYGSKMFINFINSNIIFMKEEKGKEVETDRKIIDVNNC